MKKLKYIFIKWLDKNPDYCWANLVSWAEGMRSFWSLFFKNHSEYDYKWQVCRKAFEGTPSPYCGKCGLTGKFEEMI